MSEFLAGMAGGLGASLAWLVLVRILRGQLTEERARVADLIARLQARDPGEYRAWSHATGMTSPMPESYEPRLFSEDGLLSVPYEDRGED